LLRAFKDNTFILGFNCNPGVNIAGMAVSQPTKVLFFPGGSVSSGIYSPAGTPFSVVYPIIKVSFGKRAQCDISAKSV